VFVKDVLYGETLQNVNDLRDRFVRAAKFLTNEMLASTSPETVCHLDVCCAANGAILRSTEHTRNFVRSSVSITLYG
jgi:hypothetical protein